MTGANPNDQICLNLYCPDLDNFNRLLHTGAGSDPATCATYRCQGVGMLHAWTLMGDGRGEHQGNKTLCHFGRQEAALITPGFMAQH